GSPCCPPGAPGAERRGDRADGARALGRARPHCEDRRARPRRGGAHLPCGRGHGCAASRRAAPVPPARGRARAGSSHERRRLPGPKPTGMSATDILELTASAAAAAIAAAPLAPAPPPPAPPPPPRPPRGPPCLPPASCRSPGAPPPLPARRAIT